MTAVLGVVGENSLAFCSDQQISYGSERKLCRQKWLRINSIMVGWSGIGATYQWAWSRLFREHPDNPISDEPISMNEQVDRIARSWRSWMKERGCLDSEGDVPGRLLIGIGRALWRVDGDGSCHHSLGNTAAIGTGSTAAEAAARALLTANPRWPAEDIARLAISSAVEVCCDLYGVAIPQSFQH